MGVWVHKDNMHTAMLPTVTGDGKWYNIFHSTGYSPVQYIPWLAETQDLQTQSTKLQVSSVVVSLLIWFIADLCPV